MWKASLLTLALGLCSAQVFGQNSDLYIFDLTNDGQNYHLDNPQWLSSFNQGGYTNQPHFIDAYRLLVAVGQMPNPADTDLYEIKLRSKNIGQITRTVDREYSPSLSQDRNHIQCVLVDTENDNAQILWEYPLDRSSGGRPLLPEANDVGYFAELGEAIAVFEVGDPHKLFVYDRNSGEKTFVNNNIGRTLKRTPDGTLAYVHKFSDSYWYLKTYDLTTRRSTIVKKTIPEAEYFEVLKDGSYLMAGRSKLYRLDPKGTNEWVDLGSFAPYQIGTVTRIAYNGLNTLAVITTKP